MEGTYKILVVDDNKTNVNVCIEGLKETSDNYEFFKGYDGTEALTAVKLNRPDIILLDVEMPQMSGYDVCRILKSNKNFGFIPIILMTAKGDMESKVEGLELGADDYLIKPVNMMELAARVKSMLRLKSMHDQLMEINRQLEEKKQELFKQSITDNLTQLYNRLYFIKRLSFEFNRAKRYQHNLSCIMMDIDHFKNINDNHGHQLGDLVLKEASAILKNSLDKEEIIARYGGEEFIIILVNRSTEEAVQIAEKLRKLMEETEYSDGVTTIHATMSMGVSTYPSDRIEDEETLVKLADEALYVAKKQGRNRVINAMLTN